MRFHFREQTKMGTAVQEHPAYDYSKDILRRTGNPRVVKQVASAIFGFGKKIFRQPAHRRVLVEAFARLQQFQSMQHASVLVLPATSGREQLFEYQSPVANLVLIPRQAAKIRQCAQYRSREDRTGSQTGTGRNSSQQRHFQPAAECFQLFFQRSITAC